MKFAVALIVLVFIRHYGAGLMHDDYPYAAWFYMFGGVYEALLCLLVGFCCWTLKRGRGIALLACAWGFAEGIQMAVCRYMVGPVLPAVPAGCGLCDVATGIPAYVVSSGTTLLMLAYLLWTDK